MYVSKLQLCSPAVLVVTGHVSFTNNLNGMAERTSGERRVHSFPWQTIMHYCVPRLSLTTDAIKQQEPPTATTAHLHPSTQSNQRPCASRSREQHV